MEILSLAILFGIPVFALLWFSLWIGDRSRDGAIKRAQERHQQQLDEQYARLLVTPRWTDDELAMFHPDSTIVFNTAQRLDDEWHALLTAFDSTIDLNSIAERTFLRACTGQEAEPIGIIALAPAFDALEHTITCQACRQTLSRVYAFNKQPPYTYDLHPQAFQLMLTPDLVTWDTSPLRTEDTKLMRKKPVR